MLLEDQGRGPWDTSGPRIVLPCEALFRVAPPPRVMADARTAGRALRNVVLNAIMSHSLIDEL